MKRPLCIIFLILLATRCVRADAPIPAGMQDVGVDEHLNAQLPLDVSFTNELGQKVKLRDCLTSGKPAILQLGYFGCPMLCDVISQGMLRTLQEMDLDVGKDFTVIYISFDERETKNDAYLKKRTYVQRYDRDGAAPGWHFLVGDKVSVKAIADAVGFKYKWVESSQQFSHPAVLTLLTPDGHVSRYLYGVEFPQQTMRLSLVEASQGKIGTTIDQVLMLCFHYDPNEGRYTLAAMALMRTGGALTAIVLAAVLGRLFLKERRLRAQAM